MSTGPLSSGRGWLLGVLAAAIGFVAVNLGVSQISGVRLDLTEDRLFTLSDGAKRVLATMPQPVSVTLYYSQELGDVVPAYAAHATRVQDLLREFESAAGGKLTVNILDPEPFSEIEDQAVELGMQGVPLDDTGDEVYFGLFVSVDGVETGGAIPFLQIERDTFLEYDLTKLIWRVSNPEQPIVGVISGKNLFGDPMAALRGAAPEPYYAIVQAQDFFDLRLVNSAEALLDADPDMLLIVHPPELDDPFLYAIDQFLMERGRALVFLDPFNESAAGAQPMAPGMPPTGAVSSNLARLLEGWGVSVTPEQIVGDRQLGRVVNAGAAGQVVAAPYAAWIQPRTDQMNQEDAVMATLQEMLLATPGAIVAAPDAAVSVTPLITTTEDSALFALDQVRTPEPLALLDGFEPSGEIYTLATRITGRVQSAFPDGAPPAPEENLDDPEGDAAPDGEENEEEPVFTTPPETVAPSASAAEDAGPDFPPHIPESVQPLNLILVADADMVEDRFWVSIQTFFGQRIAQPFLDNGAFLVNGLENLNGSNDLLSLRARRTGARPFERIDDIRRQAEAEYRSEEQALQRRLQELEQQMAALREGEATNGGDPAGAAEDPEAALDRFTDELVETRRALRTVSGDMRKDIEDLQSTLRFLNIAAGPIVVILVAILIGVYRRRTMRPAR
ncbi:MAG: Gldg family protein [Alphaproteobacteria bacterium]|nr:Gldg family protein [Alphaproteobacteria bacterium]